MAQGKHAAHPWHPARMSRHAAHGQAIDGGQVVGFQAVPHAEDKDQRQGGQARFYAHASSATLKPALTPATHLSRPRISISCGKLRPIKIILLARVSSSRHGAPSSEPISMCTPWNTARHGVPAIFKMPL